MAALMIFALACASRPPLPPAGPRPSDEEPVIVYGAPWCRFTRAAMDYFRGRQIPAQMRDVESDPAIWDEMMARARAASIEARGIPILSVRGRVLVGFHQDEVERALED